MTKHMPAWTSVAMAFAVPMWLLATPAMAQSKGASGGGGGGSHASSGGGGGGHASGGGAGGGGGHASGGSSGGGSHVGGGGASSGRASAGSAVSRGSVGGTATSRGAVARGPVTGNTATSNSGAAGTAVSRGTGSGSTAGNVPPNARPRDGRPSVGTAVPRTSVTVPATGVTSVFVPGYYGGYYPYGLGLGFIGGYYGGYYGGYDDMYDPGYASAPGRSDDSGGLKLKIKPSEATVYVDGYYVGVVNDFDGVFQKLTIEPGAHRVEIRAPGYEPLAFDIRIESGHTTTYRGEMKKLAN